jgi:hypothetical protein
VKSLRPPDSHHLQAAEGWIGLGNYAEANDELEQIAAANRAHPDVLQFRGRSISHSADRSDGVVTNALNLPSLPKRRAELISEIS